MKDQELKKEKRTQRDYSIGFNQAVQIIWDKPSGSLSKCIGREN